MTVTVHPVFSTPCSLEEALHNLLALEGEIPEHWWSHNFGLGLVWVACYGPIYRWDGRDERYLFQGRTSSGLGENYSGALTRARTLAARMVFVLGTDSPTPADVRAALADLAAGGRTSA